MKLKKITIHKFKSINTDQSMNIEDDITILVGMNESGKTACLEAMAKTNYHQSDDKLSSFSRNYDYPRAEMKSSTKEESSKKAITCEYDVGEEIIEETENKICFGILKNRIVKRTHKYDEEVPNISIEVDYKPLQEHIISTLNIPADKISIVKEISDRNSYDEAKKNLGEDFDFSAFDYLLRWSDDGGWADFLGQYVYREIVEPRLPKFIYYDEYYSLPQRVPIEKLSNNDYSFDGHKTARALVEIAEIDVKKLVDSVDFETSKAELETASLLICEKLFPYWKTNENLGFVIEMDKSHNEHILDMRVRNKTQSISLPLTSKSKGFKWFFSFIIWFTKIQEDENTKYILLLDEPGLNLHASAQSDLLRFLEDLTKKHGHQIIYTTHSPFMIESGSLHRVRTTLLKEDSGTKLSDNIQEKDPKTLFPLQAALGYDIAQNLFVNEKNLLVEGVSDLVYLEIFSNLLKDEGKKGLDDSITIIPVGGLERVSSFISLLRGSKLKILCLLDSPSESQKQRLENVIKNKLIKKSGIRYFHEYIENEGTVSASIEDLFDPQDYLKLFNKTFEHKYKNIDPPSLSKENISIVKKIDQLLKKQDKKHKRFNHFLPANFLSRAEIKSICDEKTLNNFEKIFSFVNSSKRWTVEKD